MTRGLVAVWCFAACAAAQEKNPLRVTIDSFIRAETDRAFAGVVKEGGFGKFNHAREVTALDKQPSTGATRPTTGSRASQLLARDRS